MRLVRLVRLVMCDRWRCSQHSRSGYPGTRRGTHRLPPQAEVTDHTFQHRNQLTPTHNTVSWWW